MAQVRIRSFHGGLGDELQFSTFAEALTKQGHEVFLLKDNDKVHPIRNEGIKHFLYAHNPFIKGELAGNWDFGDNREYRNTQDDFIKNWEAGFDLPPENSLPKIYYEPNKLLSIKGLVELSSISLAYDRDEVIRKVQAVIKESGIPFKQLISSNQSNPIVIPGLPVIQANNLYEVSDCIFSCSQFLSLSSGSHSLAAAIRRKADFKQICLLPKEKAGAFLASKLFIYPGTDYLSV